MNRYLIYISYIGTNFKSFTKAIANGKVVEPTTIGVIENALQVLKPNNLANVRSISRTDAGVHALNSAVVVDLERKNGKPYDCNYITSMLNDSFADSPYEIRVNRTEMVPKTFNAHVNAVKSRTYLYRLGIMKGFKNVEYRLEEKDRCYFMYADNFDIDRLKEAAQMFVGKHDFRTFMTINNNIQNNPSFSVRQMHYVKVERSYNRTIFPMQHNDDIVYWDIIFNAQSFLYRQIRRLVGSLVAVARGRITQRDLYEMLTIPSQESFSHKVTVAPPHALYLADIEFRTACLTNDIYSRSPTENVNSVASPPNVLCNLS